MYSTTDCVLHCLDLTSCLSSASIGDIATGTTMLIVPEEYTSGLKFFRKNGRIDEVMEFLARYVRLVHANCYYKSLLIANCGSSYLDIITASDFAYVLSLIMNSVEVWLKRKTPDGKLVKPLYTSGKGIKRVYGVTTWNKSGMKYYRDMLNKWKPAFTRGHKDFKTLRRHWDKWIESSDGGRKYALANGDATKTAYTVLRTRSEADACMPSDDDDDDDDNEEFDYGSDEDEIILSNWDGRKSVNRARVNNNDDHGDDEYDSSSDDNSSVDGSDGGRGEKDSGDDESGDEDDDGDDVGLGKNHSGDEESGDDDDDDGTNNEGREDEEDKGGDEDGGGRRLNGSGMMLEEEAVAAGMREHITNKSNNKRKGGKGLPQSEEREERPKHTRRVTAVNND